MDTLMHAYLHKLETAKQNGLSIISETFFGEKTQLTRAEYLAPFTDEQEYSQLMTAHGIRTILTKVHLDLVNM